MSCLATAISRDSGQASVVWRLGLHRDGSETYRIDGLYMETREHNYALSSVLLYMYGGRHTSNYIIIVSFRRGDTLYR